MKRRRDEFKRASDPASSLVYGVLDALEKRITRFVVAEMNQISRFIRRLRHK